ncbi:MAG: NBR1-Ig-like domain-containing protein [Anaerolineae bacterium]|nr:NBR1-Ig-like domain-containing protein [Anaerolineae bacterium]
MNSLSTFPAFEDKMRAATKDHIPQPDKEFVERLRRQLAQRRPAPLSWAQRLGLTLQRPRLSIALIIFTLLILATLIIGPQNVVSALQNLFGYVPGIGFVEADLVLVEPVSLEREGITLTIENLVATKEETTLIYRATNLPLGDLAAYRQAHQDDPDLDGPLSSQSSEHTLRAQDGTVYPGRIIKGSMEKDGRPDKRGTDWVGVIVFPPLPAGTRQITFQLDVLPNLYPGMAPENWEITIQLEPATGENPIPAYQPDYATLTPEAHPQPEITATPSMQAGVQLILNAVSVYENSLTISVSVLWENPFWNIADLRAFHSSTKIAPVGEPSTHYLTLTDANGTQVVLLLDILESPMLESERKATYIFSANVLTRNLVSPLTLTLNSLNITANLPPEEQARWSFEFTPTTAFQPGDCEPFSHAFNIYGIPFEFVEVCSILNPAEARTGGGGGGGGPSMYTPTPRPPIQYGLALHYIIGPDGDILITAKEAGKECPTNCAGAGWWGHISNEAQEWTSDVINLFYEQPTWPVTYIVDGIDFLLPGPWSIQFNLPPIQERNGEVDVSGGFEAAHLVAETIPDGTVMSPGENFIKTFILKNIGETTWEENYQLIIIDAVGDQTAMGSPLITLLGKQVAPGEEVEISIPLTAPPTPGRFVVVWKLINGQEHAVLVDGGNIWVHIVVTQALARVGNNVAISAMLVFPLAARAFIKVKNRRASLISWRLFLN